MKKLAAIDIGTNSIKLLVANYPELRNPRDYPFASVDESVQRLAAANKLPYLSMLPSVSQLQPASLWVTVPDPHPSIAAHAAFAKELYHVFDAELRQSRGTRVQFHLPTS